MRSVARRPRPVEDIEFDPRRADAIVVHMDHLADAGDGWMNLLPGVPEEDAEPPARGVFSVFFGSASPPVSMCTWTPARKDRSDSFETVGILHPRGRNVVRQLAELDVALPQGWRVRQDSPSRGLVVGVPPCPHAETLDWMIRAGSALSKVPLTGVWKARVYLPR